MLESDKFPAKHAKGKPWLFLIGAALLLAALGLRIISAWNDLWFDEIISIKLASQMSGWHGIFTEFKYDNNHYLNTFWVYALGTGKHAIVYRLPAIIAGMATIAAAFWTLKPYGRTAQSIAALLIAFSHLQIHYSSEARGYSLHLLFAVLAFGCLDRFHRNTKIRFAICFGVFATLALLSHLLTINFLLACGIWSVSFQTKQPIPARKQLARLFACHLIPLVAGVALYLINVRDLEFGGGPKYNTLLVLTSAWSLLIGVASPGMLRVVTGVFAICLTIVALNFLRNKERNELQSSESWKFFLAFLILIPLARIVIPSSLLFTRYFLLQITFGMLLFGIVGANIASKPTSKPLLWGLVVLFIALNIGQTSRLIMHGRGNYQWILHSINDRTEGDLITVASSNKILDKPVFDFFVNSYGAGFKRVQWNEQTESPEWFIEHRTMDCAANTSLPPMTIQISGAEYRLQFRSQASYLSGFEWNCYQKENQ